MNSSTFYEELASEITRNPDFVNDYRNLQSIGGPSKHLNGDFDQCRRLLESASILACSAEEDHRIIALEIAGAVIENEQANDVLKAASELVFLRLGNFPTLRLSISRYGDFLDIMNGGRMRKVPITLNMEIVGKKITNQISIADKQLFLIDFQIDVLNLLREGKSISISAPTSTGKSFVLTTYAIDALMKKDRFTIVYIVPTRALITQVQREFRKALREFSVEDTMVFSTSWEVVGEGRRPYSKAIMILTQERLQAIEGKTDQLEVDLLIVDEAQKIEEGARGILLEESVQQLIDWNPDAQVVFISPFTENPEKLGSVFYCGEVDVVKTTISPVSQRVLHVDIDRKDVDISLLSQALGKRLHIGRIRTEKSIPTTMYERRAWVATNVVESGSTMVYCNGPSDCRKTANAISKMSTSTDIHVNVKDVVRYLERHIHKDYFLIDYLRKGVGYHYGDMPGSVRLSVESLFANRQIDRICCTSTLLVGVNFPAKNIVIYKPRMGKLPMEELSFLNLAGRAGRLMKDFCGNIYCIDVEDWKGHKPGLEKVSHRISSSMEDVIKKKKDLIIQHLREYEREKKTEHDDVEAAVTRFIINEVHKGNKEFVGQLLERDADIMEKDLDEIVDIVQQIEKTLVIPGEIILEHRSIDPRLQNNLYEAVTSMESPPIPLHPMDSGFYDSLEGILELTNRCLCRGQNPRFLRRIALLAMRWAREETLGEIISHNIGYLERKSEASLTREEVNREIENTIRNINSDISYRFCRDISCYTSILKALLKTRNLDIEIDEKIGYYIEIGAHKPTTLTLLNNGIPRTPAILISRGIPPDIQEFEQCSEHVKGYYSKFKSEIPSILLNEFFEVGNSSISS